jgi:hypothetical protein
MTDAIATAAAGPGFQSAIDTQGPHILAVLLETFSAGEGFALYRHGGEFYVVETSKPMTVPAEIAAQSLRPDNARIARAT